MSQLSREMLFSGCYLNPNTSSRPEPKHQHQPPTLKALGVELKQSSISCVYFPCVTSTCVANTLPAGSWGEGGRGYVRGWERSYAIGVGNEQLPCLGDSTSSPTTNRVLCSTTATPSISAVNAKACEGFSLSFREH